MKLYRLRLVPESPWRTPWQSDTLAGLLCWMCARTEGDVALRQGIIEPALAGRPPFVLSDAFPGKWFPMPAAVQLSEWPVEHRKTVKRARWLSTEAFHRVQGGATPALEECVAESGIHEYTRLRNAIGRENNATAKGSGLFPTEESVLGRDQTGRPIEFLSLYARISDEFVPRFRQLMEELVSWGFGADHSAGLGHFRLGSELEPAEELDAAEDANGCVVLSTFQPAASDPTNGAWESFTKYGKLGPDFGLENVFKRPLIMFRAGACFDRTMPNGWLGRAIPMREVVSREAAADLEGRGVSVVHWAFGLCLPLRRPSVHSEAGR